DSPRSSFRKTALGQNRGMADFEFRPVGYVRSALKDLSGAPRQASEGAPAAELWIDAVFAEAVAGLEAGAAIWIFTWLDRAKRSTLKVHPRGNPQNPLTGVFATRSPDRPNPIGLHRARIMRIAGLTIEVDALEAIDGTPILDLKPALECE